MGVVIINGPLTKEQVKVARQDYINYIKITANLEKEIVAIGGEYHADAEAILIKTLNINHSSTWGGGYDIELDLIRTDAMLNYKPNYGNMSSEILDPISREQFLKLLQTIFKDIKSLI